MVTYRSLSLCTCISLLLAACGTQSPVEVVNKGGQYFGQSPSSPPAMQVADTAHPKATAVSPIVVMEPAAPVTVTELSAPPPSGGTSGALDNSAATAPVQPVNHASELSDPFVARLAAKDAENRARMASGMAAPSASPAPAQTAEAPVELMEPAKQEMSKPIATSTGYVWPVQGVILSQFGDALNDQPNDGINISAMEGQPVVAAADGDVVFAGSELKAYGNMVILRHEDGIMTAYAHAGRILVSKGEKVRQGAAIATVGQTGDVKEPQLHFGVRQYKKPMDPLAYLP